MDSEDEGCNKQLNQINPIIEVEDECKETPSPVKKKLQIESTKNVTKSDNNPLVNGKIGKLLNQTMTSVQKA